MVTYLPWAFSTSSVDLKQALMNEIKRRSEQNHLPYRGGFLTFEFIDELFTVRNIAEQLQLLQEGPSLSWKERNRLAQSIKRDQQKLYAILLLMDKSNRLTLSKARDFTDKSLFPIAQHGLASLPCPLEKLENSEYSILFQDIAHEFFVKQFVFPPNLSTTPTPTYPSYFIFPFASARLPVDHGSYGDVRKVEIPKGFLEPLQHKESSKNVFVAYKRIRKQDTTSWKKVDLEYKVLQQRPHNNITPLWGSFFAGMEDTQDPQSTAQCLYLLSPVADMSMQKWIGDERAEHKSFEFIYFDTMLALASGLAYIHREIDDFVAYHRDIKPNNILLFPGGNDKVIWKFCDFGTSNLKSANDTRTASMVTTEYWAPEEYFEPRTEDKGLTRGRPHDVFSLGCVFLCLSTILHTGLDGFANFKKRREKADKSNKTSHLKGAFHKTMPAVHHWIENLHKKCKENQTQQVLSREVLLLISEMLQPIDKRIYSWEVEVDLHILEQLENDSTSVVNRLRQTIHGSGGYNSKTKHNPYRRAKEKADKEDTYRPKRSEEFFRVMEEYGWHDYSPQSTTSSSQRMSGRSVYSNLPPLSDQDTLCGGQKLYQQISDTFSRSDIVALYGVAGIGKSRNAFEYARQFTSLSEQTLARHVFHVNATSVECLLRSYDAIADVINSSQADPSNSYREGFLVTRYTLKSWLEDDKNGRWFMVVDGLNQTSSIGDLRNLLPTPRDGVGQILITTRDRAAAREYPTSKQHVPPCIEVTALNPRDSMRLFMQNIDESQRLESTEITDKIASLLEKLWSPIMIKLAAENTIRRPISVLHLEELVEDNGLSEVKAPFKSYLEYVLEPLDSELSIGSSRRWEVGTLFLLAFFDPDGVSWEILKKNYDKKKKKPGKSELVGVLGRLEDCALIRKVTIRKVMETTDHVYSISTGNIRQAILEKIERDDGPEGLLTRYSKALSLVYKFYQPLRKSKDSAQLRQIEHSLMPHFECFLRFTNKHAQRQRFRLHDLAVRAVICFSKVLIDQDRHKEAMEVTEYTREHFKPERADEKQMMLHFNLGRHLISIYLTRPKDATSFHYRSKAENLIAELQSAADMSKGHGVTWTWLPSMDLKIKLDQVKVYRQATQFSEAHRLLSNIQDGIEIASTKGGRGPRHTNNERIRGFAARELQTLITYQDGLLHTAEGISKHKGNPRAALESWNEARNLLLKAKKDAKNTRPADQAWHDEIRAAIAVANTKIGQKHLIQDAIKALELVLDRTKENYGSVQRTKDVERRLNEARLKSSKHDVKLAMESSRELLDWYAKHCGSHAKDTEDCALQLVRGLEKMGEMDEAQMVRKKYRLGKDCTDARNMWSWKMSIMVFFLSLSVASLYMKSQYA